MPAAARRSRLKLGHPSRETAAAGQPAAAQPEALADARAAAAVDDTRGPQRSTTRRPGLSNLGDTCFISAVVQALYSCDTIRAGVLRMAEPPEPEPEPAAGGGGGFASLAARALPRLMREMVDGGAAIVVPRELVRAVRSGTAFASGQQDAQEFLAALLQALTERQPAENLEAEPDGGGEERRAKRPTTRSTSLRGATALSVRPPSWSALGCFRGVVTTATKCLECECSTSQRAEEFSTLSVCCGGSEAEGDGAPEQRPTLSSGLAAYFSAQRLAGANKYFCSEHCFSLTEAERLTRLTELPSVLCIHVKMLSSGRRSAAADRQIDVRRWCSAGAAAAAAKKGSNYELVAAVLHAGNTPAVGHYSAICRVRKAVDAPAVGVLAPHRARNTSRDCPARAGPEWLRCDDEKVDSLSAAESEALLAGTGAAVPCLLFYARAGPSFLDFFGATKGRMKLKKR